MTITNRARVKGGIFNWIIEPNESKLEETTLNVLLIEVPHGGNDFEKALRRQFCTPHWLQATTEMMVKIGDYKESILALVYQDQNYV